VACRMLPSNPALPFQCYTRDSCIPTPWGLLIPRMGFALRAEEPNAIEVFAREAGLPIWRRVDRGTLEGGDVELLRPGVAVVGCNGDRTKVEGALQVKKWFIEAGWDCRVVEYASGFVHFDLALGVIDARNVLCCRDALAPADIQWLSALGFAVHFVSSDDSKSMACNTISLGDGRVISCSQNVNGNALLSTLGYEVIETDMGEFVADSGGVHCVVQALRRDETCTSALQLR
jgi:arginine deiminase